LYVCSFWKYVKKLDRREARRYLEMFYILRLRPLIAQARHMAHGKTSITSFLDTHDAIACENY